ncbi:MAG TPA: VOC family protein [Tepidisphaeraceae bacterium]|jgi:catechol 2,3-dioxygenase-like lactoylglutathione lyase family enzyme|nr:VOC family protein [Tepidisphaeraceae bacterium]
MPATTFHQIQPILGTRDLAKAVRFYIDRLGFTLAFGDPSIPVNYVGLRRDKAEFHMQFQYEHEMGTTRVRFLVDDPDALYEEYKDKGVFHKGTRLADTPWGTREFALYDLDRNALTFYANLKKPG